METAFERVKQLLRLADNQEIGFNASLFKDIKKEILYFKLPALAGCTVKKVPPQGAN